MFCLPRLLIAIKLEQLATVSLQGRRINDLDEASGTVFDGNSSFLEAESFRTSVAEISLNPAISQRHNKPNTR